MPDIYDIDFETQAENLNVPTKRTTRTTAFLNALMRAIQWIRDLFFDDYAEGAVYSDWANATNYVKEDRVIWTDKSVYEALLDHTSATGTNEPTGTVDSATTWMKVQDNFIGANQRLKFNSQVIILEHALNKWYRVDPLNDQIYIEVNVVPNIFVMGTTGASSSKIPNNSVFMLDYLGVNPNFSATEFTVWVPAALYTTLGSNATNRENNVRRFVDKYKISGISYNVAQYVLIIYFSLFT